MISGLRVNSEWSLDNVSLNADGASESVITKEHIKDINYELGLIPLCWPEIENPVFENRTHFPESYYKNSEKEKLTLLYAENFRRQFVHTFPNRKQLILAADNELGVQKFVCNTIRPTTLPYLELKNWKSCAQFVADHIHYEISEKPTLPPEHIYGPFTTCKRQSGNAFEMSTSLCSLLLGAGYDAYVVSGFGTQDITQYVRYRTECPIKTELPEEEVVEETVVETKYKLREIRDLRSKFILGMEQREIDKFEKEKQEELEQIRIEQEEQEKAPPDNLYGLRVHAWVLLLPKREIMEPMFIECSTGEFFPTDTNVYVALDSIWNNENYWVNLQDCSKGFVHLKFDLENLQHWQHIFIGEPIENRDIQIDPDADIEENTVLDEKHLDVPTPWSEPISIDHSALKYRFANSRKITRYKRTILEQFGDYVQIDGLKHRISRYEDVECTILTSMEDTYEHRMDCLTSICTDFKTNITTEYFKRGREDACKVHQYLFEKNTLESFRTMEFYHYVRLDGLHKLETDAVTLKEMYLNREDFLNSRLTIFAPRGKPPPGMLEGSRRIIMAITEKFNRDSTKDANDDIACREFSLVNNELHLKYHYSKGHVTASTRDFSKPNVAEIDDEIFNQNLTIGYQAEIGAKPPKNLQLFYLLESLLKDEQQVMHHVREREDEITAFVRNRAIECTCPQLHVSLFNREMNEEFKAGLREKEQQEREHQEREVEEDINYLAPYIVRLGSLKEFNADQAYILRAECVREFKQLLVDRANTLRLRLEQEYSNFLKQQQYFMNNVSLMNIEAEEQELSRLQKMRSNMHLFEVRLQRCKDLSPLRYSAFETYINTHPLLAILYDG